MRENKILLIILAVTAAALVLFVFISPHWFSWQTSKLPPDNLAAPETSVLVNYLCNDGKSITANFLKGTPAPVKPGEPPIPGGRVKINLSDGRWLDLPQTLSADGTRYASSDEAFVFWAKGNGALVLENNVAKSYIGCVVLRDDNGGLTGIYHDGTVGFNIRYPEGYVVDSAYEYNLLGPGENIGGVKFTVPSTLASGTNLSSFDTGVSIEIIPATSTCSADKFLYNHPVATTLIDNGIEYSLASTSGAAAGNYYEETVWALIGSNPCLAVRYFIHSTNLGNYPEGTVVEYDKTGLLNQFDKIRRSLISL